MASAPPSARALQREATAFAGSLCVHGALVLAILLAPDAEPPLRPFEVSLFAGPRGEASPPPGGEERPGFVDAPPAAPEPAPVEAPAPEAAPEPARAPAPPKPAPKPKPVEEQGLLGALRESDLPDVEAVEGRTSPVRVPRRRAEAPPARAAGAPGAVRGPEIADVLERGPAPDARGSRPSAGVVRLPSSGSPGPAGGGGEGRGGFSVSGSGAGGEGRSYAAIWEHTQKYLAGLRWAYNRELRANPGLRGVLTIRFGIRASGEVVDVELLSSEMSHARFEQEVLSQIRGWRYPQEDAGDVVVRWPFSFVPPNR